MSKVNCNYAQGLLECLLGGGFFDYKQLYLYIEDFEIDICETIKECDACDERMPHFNDIMYSILVAGFEKMRTLLLDTIKENGWNIRKEIVDWIKNAEVDVYINYLDSFIEAPVFRDYEYQELKNENMAAKFLGDVWKEIK